MHPRRLRRLPAQDIGDGRTILKARGVRARMLGLAFLREPPPGHALLIPRCKAVHTFGMRFALDLEWLDGDDNTLRIDRDVPPRRLRHCRAAAAVREWPATPPSPPAA